MVELLPLLYACFHKWVFFSLVIFIFLGVVFSLLSLWWRMPLKESEAAMEAECYCWVTHNGGNNHCSLSLPTHQCWHLVEKTPEMMAFWVPAVLNKREETQPKGVGFEHLMHWSIEKDQRTSQGRRPSDTKKSFWQCQTFCALGHQLPCALGFVMVPTIQAITPPPHLVLAGAELPEARKKSVKHHASCACGCRIPCITSTIRVPRSKQQHRLHNWSSLGQSCQGLGKTLKASFLLCLWLPASLCTWYHNPCIMGSSRIPAIQATTPPPQLVLTGAEMENARKNPNRTMSLVPGAASLHTWHCRGPYSPRCYTTSMSGPWWDRHPASRAASGTNSCGWPTSRDGNKATVELQGQSG